MREGRDVAVAEAGAEVGTKTGPVWTPERRPWGWGDALALTVWTAAIVVFFRDALLFGRAFFYFDVTEINYPYRDFLAREIRLGRFARWMPGLFCGLPLYAESQAGYWHPLKYLLYPWMPTWRAFNLDTILSVWLTGVGTYGWLRRHVGPAGALTGAALFGVGGFVWAHLIHTSMINALASVPFVVWALEVAWDGGRLRSVALGGLALACQVFAGHLQDTFLTAGIVGLYTLHRALTEPTRRGRFRVLGMTACLVGIGIAVSAVQWIPSKNLLDRSPRAGGLTWKQLTYGSWSPELLPSLVVREAYGTRARDTDWMDGYYPYHEMNAYLGLIGMGLAVVGAAACRDRWVSFWIALAMLGGLMMMGRFTFLFDFMNLVPIFGSSRIPVRFDLWAALALAALAAVGVDRLARPGSVQLGPAIAFGGAMVAIAVPILIYVYLPAWTDTRRWTTPGHLRHFRWLGREVAFASARTLVFVLAAWAAARAATRSGRPERRRWLAAALPVLVLVDLLGSHSVDAPTIDPSYWTDPPPTVAMLESDPTLRRINGEGVFGRSAGEPGYASEYVDFPAIRDSLAWSLAPVWGLSSSGGATPLIPRRVVEYTENAGLREGRFAIEGVSHVLAAARLTALDRSPTLVGSAYVHRNPAALPRARLMGEPEYADDESAAIAALGRLGPATRERVIVEDPGHPLPEDAKVDGTATIAVDEPERVEVETSSSGPSYLFLADTYDPGWSASVDGHPAPIRPAFVAFRAVFLTAGPHRVTFVYRPAGFRLGLIVTGFGLAAMLVLCVWPRRFADLAPAHATLSWPRRWPLFAAMVLSLIVASSTVRVGPGGTLGVHPRVEGMFHTFTWGAGIEAIRETKDALGR